MKVSYKIDGREHSSKDYSEQQLRNTDLMDALLDVSSSNLQEAKVYVSIENGEEKLVGTSNGQSLFDVLNEVGNGDLKRNFVVEMVPDKRTCGPKF